MLSSDEWQEIHRLHKDEGVSIKGIVRTTGISRNTVRRALAAPEPPVYRRTRTRGSLTDEVEPQIRELLAHSPSMPATKIAEKIGWTHSMTILKDRVRRLRPDFLPAQQS